MGPDLGVSRKIRALSIAGRLKSPRSGRFGVQRGARGGAKVGAG